MKEISAFNYTPLTEAHAEAWLTLRREGARDFPLGFLTTEEEVAEIDAARAQEILRFGQMRGVFSARTLVGFCGFRRFRPSRIMHRAEVGPFFVTAALHGSGAAQCLMAGVVAEAEDLGVARIELYVDAVNARAISFYQRAGFDHMATLEDMVRVAGRPRTEWFMVKTL